MLSIIIPVLNEALHIEKLLEHLIAASTPKNVSEIIIVDGGSQDNTAKKVSHFKKKIDLLALDSYYPKIIFLSTNKGRAKQMNRGAEEASQNILYFLHADSYPPKNFDSFIINQVVENKNMAGCFRMKFDHSHWWLRLAGWLTQFKSKACRGGDQSQFITRDLFDDIGGYDERFTIYEDYMLINQLYARKEYTVIQQWLTTSARRYNDKGIWRLQYHFWAIYVKKFLGADAHDLYRYYKKHIA